MNKFLIIITLLFSINVFAEGVAPEKIKCREAKELSGKIHNFNESDLDDDSKSFKSCGFMLQPIDQNLISALSIMATSEDVLYFKKILTSLGANAEITAEYMKGRGTLVGWIIYLSKFSYVTTFFFLTAIIGGVIFYNKAMPTIITKTVFVIVFMLVTFELPKTYTLVTIYLTGASNQITWNGADHKNLEKLRKESITNLVPAINQNSTAISQLLHQNALINVVTSQNVFDARWGQNLTLSKEWSMDNRNPTVGEFLDYVRECSATDYAIVESEINIHLKNLNFSSLASSVEFISGGKTKNYDCTEYYGDQFLLSKLSNKTSKLIERYMTNNFAPYMGQDQNWKDEFSNVMNGMTGKLILEIEKAEDTASANAQMILVQLQLAQDASEEARATDTPYTNTDSYKQLVRMHKLKMGNTFDYQKIEGVSSTANIAYQGIKLNHYNFSEWFNLSGEKDSAIPAKRMFGFHVAQPYIRKTIAYALEAQCSFSSNQDIEFRKKFATKYNNIPPDTKLKTVGTFSIKNDTNCFRFNDDGSIIAVGGGSKEEIKTYIKEFNLMIHDRVRAVDIFQTARTQAGLDLILDNDDLDKSLMLSALNTISPKFTDAMKSYTAFTEAKQQVIGALSTLQDAYIFESFINYDIESPQYFYNFKKFHKKGKSKSMEDEATALELNKYNMSPFFKINAVGFVEDSRALTENNEGAIAKAMRLECPTIDLKTGNCIASLIELNLSTYSMLFNQTKMLAYSAPS